MSKKVKAEKDRTAEAEADDGFYAEPARARLTEAELQQIEYVASSIEDAGLREAVVRAMAGDFERKKARAEKKRR